MTTKAALCSLLDIIGNDMERVEALGFEGYRRIRAEDRRLKARAAMARAATATPDPDNHRKEMKEDE